VAVRPGARRGLLVPQPPQDRGVRAGDPRPARRGTLGVPRGQPAPGAGARPVGDHRRDGGRRDRRRLTAPGHRGRTDADRVVGRRVRAGDGRGLGPRLCRSRRSAGRPADVRLPARPLLGGHRGPADRRRRDHLRRADPVLAGSRTRRPRHTREDAGGGQGRPRDARRGAAGTVRVAPRATRSVHSGRVAVPVAVAAAARTRACPAVRALAGPRAGRRGRARPA